MQFKKKKIRVSVAIGIEDWLLISTSGDRGVDVESKVNEHVEAWIESLRGVTEPADDNVDPQTAEFDGLVLGMLDRNQCDVSVVDVWSGIANRVNSFESKWIQVISAERAYIRIAKMLVRRGWIKYRTPPSYPGGRAWRYRFPETARMTAEVLSRADPTSDVPTGPTGPTGEKRITEAMDKLREKNPEDESVSIPEILDEIGVPPLRQDQIMQNTVARVLKYKNFEKYRAPTNALGRRLWRYRKSERRFPSNL